MNIAQLERDWEAKRAAANDLFKSTAATAQAENRLMTDEERAAVEALRDQALDLHKRVVKAKGDQDLLAELDRVTDRATAPSGIVPGTPARARSLGEQFLASTAYDFHRKGGHRAQSAWRSPSAELFLGDPRAATLTSDPASGGALIQPQYLPGIQPLQFAPVTVPQLFAQGTTNSNLIVFMREKTFVNAAAPVKEGTLKPESTLTFEPANSPVRKIAHWLPVSEEMLDDEPAIRSYIDARLRLGVEMEKEDQVLNGSGVDPELLGILATPGLAPDVPKGADTAADAIFKQIAAIQGTSYLMPDAIVINPADWAEILLAKDTTGRYFTPGPFSSVQSQTLWGLTVVVTPKIVAGTTLVGAFKMGGQIFERGGIRVETSNSHSNFFVLNLVAIRAEQRLSLAIYRPGAFGRVTGI